ncbi:MAG: M28 family peptidase [Promethearchaeota archaeon]|nr:MAG: M28 family peptidase [Candidatus Lokiarchaeota archaeon]
MMQNKKEIKTSMETTIRSICEDIGPRAPCSPEEAKCAEYIQEHLRKYSEKTKIEKFYCHPDTYKLTIRIPFISILIITIIYWLYYILPSFIPLLLCSLVIFTAFILIQTELTRNNEVIDRLFKEKRSTNVVGKFMPDKDIKSKQLIIIGGHHDSQYEFGLLRISPLLFELMITSSIILNYIMFVLFIIKDIFFLLAIHYLIFPLIDMIILIILTCLSPFYVFSLFKITSKNAVLGADDNLSAIAVILELAKYLKLKKLKQTEIWLVSHGCEEIGDRGSKRFSKKHKEEILEKNGYVINIDMIGGKNSELKIDIIEEVILIKLCKELGNEISKIASDLGIQHKIGNIEAFSDSMAYSMNNIKACSVISVPKKGFAAHYHTRRDTIDIIDFNKLFDVCTILCEFIERVDGNKIHIH